MEPMEYMGTLPKWISASAHQAGVYSGTHRTIEALVRGSIPIIEDRQVYGLELDDGKNCIVAEPR
jgi:hypothetical protein